MSPAEIFYFQRDIESRYRIGNAMETLIQSQSSIWKVVSSALCTFLFWTLGTILLLNIADWMQNFSRKRSSGN